MDTDDDIRSTTYNVIWIPEIPEGWEEPAFLDALQDAVDALEGDVTWTDEQDGTEYMPSVVVRSPRQREARGTYHMNANASLQILGFTVSVPDALRELLDAAYSGACEALDRKAADDAAGKKLADEQAAEFCAAREKGLADGTW